MKKKLRVGIIGGGRIGKVHAANLRSHAGRVEVRALADPFLTPELSRQAREWNIPQVYRDYKDILQDPEIDGVLICSPTDTHAGITREAARAGKHIFCEKPLDQDPQVIRETLKVVQKAGVVFQIGFNRRFDHNFQALRKTVSTGSLGDIYLLSLNSRDPAPPPLDYIRGSGGIFLDMSIHDFDMARFLLGSEVVKVHAAGAVLVDPAIGGAGDVDTAVITLWFENGALGVINNSRKAVYGYDQRGEILGSLGSARIENDTPSTLVLSSRSRVSLENPLPFFLERYTPSYSLEIEQFARTVGEGGRAEPGAVDALQSVLIALAAQESLQKGRPVAVPRG